MKKEFLALTLTALIISSSWTTIRSNNSTFISWDETRKLSWQDFRGAVSRTSHADAATAISISARPFYHKKRLFYDVNAYFIPEQSWSKAKSAQLLRHEQLHFDIAELYARKVRKKISEYRQMGIQDLGEYNRAISSILQESNRIDVQYDFSTFHGALTEKQARWEKEINTELQVLNNFSKTNWK
jgi:hypothetical protein